MKKVNGSMTKAKAMMVLSVMAAFGKNYDKITKSCTLTLNSIKAMSSKIEVNSARVKTLNFLSSIPQDEIKSNDLTLLTFMDKSVNILIENSVGNGKIRSFESIKDLISKELEDIDNTQVDYSHKLLNVL